MSALHSTNHRSSKMRFDIPNNFSTVLSGAALVAFASIHDVSARLVVSSDIRKQVLESKTVTKVKGDECIKLDAGIVNKEDVESIDLGILGCGEALICSEDETSSSGARCVDFEEASVYEMASCNIFMQKCFNDLDCCEQYRCSHSFGCIGRS